MQTDKQTYAEKDKQTDRRTYMYSDIDFHIDYQLMFMRLFLSIYLSVCLYVCLSVRFSAPTLPIRDGRVEMTYLSSWSPSSHSVGLRREKADQ